MPLSFIKEGESATVHHVSAESGMKKHLMDLGFVEGVKIKVVSRMGENLIVQVLEARIALNKEMAMKIMVNA